MAEHICRKGWIMAPSPEDGEHVPFFVQVRDKDIVWDEETLPKLLNDLSLLGSEREIFYPVYQWKIKINGWVVTLNQDATYTAIKKVKVTDNFTSLSDGVDLYANLILPFETYNDDNFSVQATKMSNDNDVISANLSVGYDWLTKVSMITVSLKNQSGMKLGEYTNSAVSITVTGKVVIQ